MINVCFSLNDKHGNYCKYLGVAIYSLLKNTTDENICLHVIHDLTFNRNDRTRINDMVKKFNQEVEFYLIDEDDFPHFKKKYSVATLFRLKLADILPRTINKIIYLDVDIIVNMNISSLWKLPFDNKSILGRKDLRPEDYCMCKKGIIPAATYINAGIMLLDLEKIRYKNLFMEAVDFFSKYPDAPLLDQDAINYVFKGEIGLIEEKYNYFTVCDRGNEPVLQERIYHFAGDHPRANGKEIFDRLFFSILSDTPWGDKLELLNYYYSQVSYRENQADFIRKLIRLVDGKRKIFFGARSLLDEQVRNYFFVNYQNDYYVDNNINLVGRRVNGLFVRDSSVLKNEDKDAVFIIVLSLNYYFDIKKQLEFLGFIENRHFIDGRRVVLESEKDGYFRL